MKIEIKKLDNKLHVSVLVPARKRDERMASWGTKEVLAWIRENKPSYDIDSMKIIKQPEKKLHNSINKSRLSGEWVFERELLAPTPKSKTKAYKKDPPKKNSPVSQKDNKKTTTTSNKTTKKPSTRRTPQTTADILTAHALQNKNKKG
jgi:hypothetical protein